MTRSPIQVTQSIPKVTFMTVINDIGSSLGLWLGASIFSIFKMIQTVPLVCSSSTSQSSASGAAQRYVFTIVVVFATLGCISLGVVFAYLPFSEK